MEVIMRKVLASTWLVIIAGLLLSAPDALAQKAPDGATPANEGVCSPLKNEGVTKGLYGLCVAYCEAQDMDPYPDQRPERIVEKVPNSKILRNYNRKKTDTDPEMPCISNPCPCFDSELIAEFGMRTFGGTPTNYCQIRGVNGEGTIQTFINESYTGDSQPITQDYFATVVQFADGHSDNSGQQFCRYADTVSGTDTSYEVSADEYAGCMTLIETRCSELGWLND